MYCCAYDMHLTILCRFKILCVNIIKLDKNSKEISDPISFSNSIARMQ